LFYQLDKNPHIRKRLTEEINNVIKSEDDIT